jgi:hypothetical protein
MLNFHFVFNAVGVCLCEWAKPLITHTMQYCGCTTAWVILFALGLILDLLLILCFIFWMLPQHKSNIKPSILGLYKYIIGC